MTREFIFVDNTSTDNSAKIIDQFIKNSFLDARLVSSKKKGVLSAFRRGIAEKKYSGFVGKFDADIILHPHVLDLMQMHLVETPAAKVTYAEPLPLENLSIYNLPWFSPKAMSKRLYFTGKTSLYRNNPHADPDISRMPGDLVVDDIFPSFYYVYYYGFESISRAPHAFVYEKVAGNFTDLVSQISRAESEIKRIFAIYPHLRLLGNIMDQEVYDNSYKSLLNRARKQTTYLKEWARLESTK